MLKLIKMIFCKRTFLLQFFDWWQVSATVEVTKGLLLASEITIVNVTQVTALVLYCFTWGRMYKNTVFFSTCRIYEIQNCSVFPRKISFFFSTFRQRR